MPTSQHCNLNYFILKRLFHYNKLSNMLITTIQLIVKYLICRTTSLPHRIQKLFRQKIPRRTDTASEIFTVTISSCQIFFELITAVNGFLNGLSSFECLIINIFTLNQTDRLRIHRPL